MTERRATKGSNKNRRPSAKAGRALKAWMLAEFGDGISCLCAFGCGRVLLYSTMTKDLWPVPARRGGRYHKGNVRPACLSCNAADGARQAAIERTERKIRHDAQLARRRELYALRIIESNLPAVEIRGEEIVAECPECSGSGQFSPRLDDPGWPCVYCRGRGVCVVAFTFEMVPPRRSAPVSRLSEASAPESAQAA